MRVGTGCGSVGVEPKSSTWWFCHSNIAIYYAYFFARWTFLPAWHVDQGIARHALDIAGPHSRICLPFQAKRKLEPEGKV